MIPLTWLLIGLALLALLIGLAAWTGVLPFMLLSLLSLAIIYVGWRRLGLPIQYTFLLALTPFIVYLIQQGITAATGKPAMLLRLP